MNCQKLFRQIAGVMLVSLYLTGCSAPERTVAPESKTPSATETNPATASPAATPTASDAQPPFSLPAPLYVLSDQSGIPQVWQFTINGGFFPLTDAPTGVSAFDITPEGQVVYRTQSGEIWIASPTDEEHRLLDLPGAAVHTFALGSGALVVYIDAEGALWATDLTENSAVMLADPSPSGTKVSGLVISPDGAQVAYVVRTPDVDCTTSGFPGVDDGIWVVNTTGGTPRQLAQSYCQVGEGGSLPVLFRSVPTWSPDNNRLLVPTSTFEGSYYGVLDLAEGTLRYPDPVILLSGNATWSRDGQAILGTDSRFLAPDNLLLVDAATLDATVLLNGQPLGLVTVEHHQLADGRIAFWMAEFDDNDPAGMTYDLYLGAVSDGVFTYDQVVSADLPQPRNVAWGADESAVAVEFHQKMNGELASGVALISLRGQVTTLEASWSPMWGAKEPTRQDESP